MTVDLIKVTRKDFGDEYAKGIVFSVLKRSAVGVTVRPYDKEDGLLYHSEVKAVKASELVGAVVSPIDDRWQGWPPGEYKVLSVDGEGVRVKHPHRGTEGVFLYSLFKLVKPQPKLEFSLAEAQAGAKLKFRSGCDVQFIAYVPGAKPHCQLVLLNPGTGNIVTRYATGRADDEPQEHANPGDILINRGDAQ